ncbi:hypothetical protein NFC69_01125 [Rhizobium sp. SSA_523]|nr:hypothetical protein [Rhizobium sp. SSA_523]
MVPGLELTATDELALLRAGRVEFALRRVLRQILDQAEHRNMQAIQTKVPAAMGMGRYTPVLFPNHDHLAVEKFAFESSHASPPFTSFTRAMWSFGLASLNRSRA